MDRPREITPAFQPLFSIPYEAMSDPDQCDHEISQKASQNEALERNAV
jgi:hypothetical protein